MHKSIAALRTTFPSIFGTAGANLVQAVAGGLGGILVARELGISDRGILLQITAVATLLGPLFSLGLDEAGLLAIGRSIHEGERSDTLVSGAALAVGVGIVAGAVSLGVTTLMLSDLPASQLRASRAYSVALPPMYVVSQYFLGAMRGREQYRTWNLMRAALPTGMAAAYAALALLGMLGVPEAVYVQLAANALLVLVALFVFRGMLRKGHFVLATARTMAQFGWRIHLGSLQNMSSQRLDRVAIAALVPPRAAGAYAVATTYASIVLLVSTSPGWQFFSASASSPEKLNSSVRQAARTAFGMAVVGALLAAVIAPWFLPVLFGEDYTSAVPLAVVLVFGAPFLASAQVWTGFMKLRSIPMKAARAEFAGFLVAIAAIVVVIPILGVVGAAIGSTLAYAATFLQAKRLGIRHGFTGPGGDL